MISRYFSRIENILSNCSIIVKFEINIQKINDSFGIVNGVAFFNNGILNFLEVVKISEQNKPVKMKYKYNFRNTGNVIIFRYDNMPHYPNVITFPHHKHTIDSRIIDSDEPELIHVIKEIYDMSSK
jgi:hypothetical protein